ncbi:hypothetical protein Gotri_012122 [Gossypium trilobum]|uniref:Uncharacterized protein n=1 Tax=Gossypium trilobum TaxID=34281 RepID=A0A7J9DP45_9ROSI|nr:hypothetical protein [Gossypium trilobum]
MLHLLGLLPLFEKDLRKALHLGLQSRTMVALMLLNLHLCLELMLSGMKLKTTHMMQGPSFPS